MRKFVIIGIFVAIILLPFVVFAVSVLRRSPRALPPVELELWTVFDEKEDFQPAIDAFQSVHRNVTITVRTKRMETYEQELVEAWARGAGPDIFTIPSTWIGKYEGFITPLPQTTRVPYYEDRKFLWKTDTRIAYRNDVSVTPREINERYVDVVARDVIRQGQIYGLPFAMDTLLLYYNRDLLNSAQIVAPATTWEELVEQVPRLTLIDQSGEIVQSGVALGTAANVERSQDILSLLMMQNGTPMTDATNRKVTFDAVFGDDAFSPGGRALRFYTDFANIGKSVYSWNAAQPNSLDAFLEGNVAYFFGYGYHEKTIRERSGALNWGKSDMLHLNTNGTDNDARTGRAVQINQANYWVFSAAKQSENTDLAWNFVQFGADASRVPAYLERTGKVAALRSILESQVNDPDLSIVARQALSARNWYAGENAPRMEEVMRSLIENINAGQPVNTALGVAAKHIQLTYTK